LIRNKRVAGAGTDAKSVGPEGSPGRVETFRIFQNSPVGMPSFIEANPRRVLMSMLSAI
jgi:hypothetical protein